MHCLKRNVYRLALLIAAVWCLSVAGASAANITVCASGCTYDNTQLSTAITAAVPGDVILLQSGFTYVGEFRLRQKTCPAQNDTCYITIKTGVNASGVLLGAASFPAANVRVTPAYSPVLAKLQGQGNNVMPLRTVTPGETGSGCAVAPCIASYWRIQLIEFISNSYGGNTFLALGNNDSSGAVSNGDTQNNKSEEPHHLIVDQCYFNGNAVTGQERAMLIAARDVVVQNNYMDDIKALSDKAGIWVDNSTGNISIINNYIEGGTENIIFGGDTSRMARTVTVLASPAPTTTTFTMSEAAADFINVGDGVSVMVGGVKRYTHITNINGAAFTVEALPGAPDVPGSVNYSVVPREGLVQKNYLFKNPAWRNPIVPTPQSVTASGSITGGTLAAGSYSYRVVARQTVAAGQTARSTASVEVEDAVDSGSTGSVLITWAAVANATQYYIYGRSAGGQNIRWSVNAPTTSYLDTGAAGTTENVPTSTGSTWMMKNLFEIKKYRTMTVEGNLMDYSWQSGQTGFAVLFTPANNSNGVDGNDSAVIRDIIFRYNHMRHSAAAFQIAGLSADGDISDVTRGMQISHNLFEDVGTAWGGKENMVMITTGNNAGFQLPRAPIDTVINHNTFINAQSKSMVIFDLLKGGVQYEMVNVDITNNMFRRGDFGLRSNSPGLIAEGLVSWDTATDGASSWLNNVVVGASCSVYPGPPASTFCPSETTFQGSFRNYAANDFKVTSVWHTSSTTGTPVGADVDLITPFTAIAQSGNNSGGAPPPVPPTITTSALPSGSVASAYTATLNATGGTTPYVWTLESGSTLPSGLTLSTAGVISGTPLAPGTTEFTVRVTGKDTGTSTKPLSISINDILTPQVRPDRFNWSEVGIFRRDVCPTDPVDEVRVGDFCFELTTNDVFKATATAPTITWEPLSEGGGGGGGNVLHITLVGTSSATHSNVPIGGDEFPGVNRMRQRSNFTSVTQCAMTGYVVGAGVAGSELRVQYWDGAVWQNSGVTMTLASTGQKELGYVTIPAGMRTDLQSIRMFTSDGDGALDPSVGVVNIVCKP